LIVAVFDSRRKEAVWRVTLDRLLTRGQAARRLDRSTQRVDQYVKEGRLPCVYTPYGRLFNPADVDPLAAALEQRRTAADADRPDGVA
jgi:hypothetical protein